MVWRFGFGLWKLHVPPAAPPELPRSHIPGFLRGFSLSSSSSSLSARGRGRTGKGRAQVRAKHRTQNPPKFPLSLALLCCWFLFSLFRGFFWVHLRVSHTRSAPSAPGAPGSHPGRILGEFLCFPCGFWPRFQPKPRPDSALLHRKFIFWGIFLQFNHFCFSLVVAAQIPPHSPGIFLFPDSSREIWGHPNGWDV